MTGKVPQKGSAAETVGSLITGAKLQQLYSSMLKSRLLNEHARQQMGQEALTTGWMIDLQPQDTVVPAGIASLVKGNLVAQLSAATDAAAAHKRKKKSNVVLMFAGVDMTKVGAWRATLKLAAKRRLPVIFVVENNPWVGARATALDQDESVPKMARRAGLPAITVDGNDVVAVYRVACESLQRVRRGDGPVLVEGKTFRTTGQRSVRSERDPLLHMEQYLRGKKLFTAKWKNQLKQELAASVAGRS